MRIVGGELRGRRLAKPVGDIRPTTDRLRESLFNVLGESVAGTTWMDAFAGSGAVGIEALSRGAALAIFNDSRRDAIRLLKRNLALCGVEEGVEVHQRDVFTFFKQTRGRAVDFIFLDPPYAYRSYGKLLKKIADLFGARPSLMVILEVFKKTDPGLAGTDWEVARILPAGDSKLLFLKWRA